MIDVEIHDEIDANVRSPRCDFDHDDSCHVQARRRLERRSAFSQASSQSEPWVSSRRDLWQH